MRYALHLYRADFIAFTADGLQFPEADQGFKGSAWHGRIDHVIRRHPALGALLPEPGRSGAVSKYWVEAPEDRSDAEDGPFTRRHYPPGHSFQLSVFVAGRPLNSALLQGLTEALQRAGQIDPAQLTDEHSARQRLMGRFHVKPHGVHAFSLGDLQPVKPSGPRAALDLLFFTMLRLDDGESLRQAREGLREGGLWVPRLSLLAAKVIDRCRSLDLGAEAPWLLPALIDCEELLKARASEIELLQAGVYPCDFSRLSARAQRHDPLGGLIGRAVYGAPSDLLGQVFPLFKLAEWTRIGRKTGLGAGRIQARLLP